MSSKSLIHWRVLPRIVDLPWQVDSIFEPVVAPGGAAWKGGWSPAVDIREKDEALIIVTELPGVMQGDVKVTVVDGVLTIQGEKKIGQGAEGEMVLRRERMAGPFVRRIFLPASVDGAGVTAAYRDGVLTIRVPKKEAARSKSIAIEVK